MATERRLGTSQILLCARKISGVEDNEVGVKFYSLSSEILFCSVLYYTVLYCILLCCAALHCTVLYTLRSKK